MYNFNTEQKIKGIPAIGEIDINRLPQELTRIYALIVSARREFSSRNQVDEESLITSIRFLQRLANNLETILLSSQNHEQKESIAYVAATANSLILKMEGFKETKNNSLEISTISPHLATVVLFLIGNSQADAAELALSFSELRNESLPQQRLVFCIAGLATGRLGEVAKSYFPEEEAINKENLQETALNLLWRELGLGIIKMARKIIGLAEEKEESTFSNVISLSKSEPALWGHKYAFEGPYRLAKLLKNLETDIYNRSIINIPAPPGVDESLWYSFLRTLANDRPYLWENHMEAVRTGLLNPGVSSVLTLPTGAGKSTIAELKIASCLYSGRTAIYLVPTHALEDQVNNNIKKLFKVSNSNVLHQDDEYSEYSNNSEANQILVMTPERCLTLLNINPEVFQSVGLIVFDEFHLIHGTDIKKDRRSIDAMYCLLSLFTSFPQADYLLISAMVENGDEISGWVGSVTERRCIHFNSTWKPTRQLHGCLVFDAEQVRMLQREITQNRFSRGRRPLKTPPSKLKRQMSIIPQCFFSLKNIWETDEDKDYFHSQILGESIHLGINNQWQLTSNRNEIAAKLAIQFAESGLKTLVFVDNPIVAKTTAERIAARINEMPNGYVEFLEQEQEKLISLQIELGGIQYSYFHEQYNVGVHHGLLLPIERNLIELYFKSRDGARVLVATATLAQGINLPAEMVIIAGDDRFDEDEGTRYQVKPHELLNAAGRAGRAGQSAQGAVILIPGEIVTIEGEVISQRWWRLKEDVFSKGDNCLRIEDPLEYFLDSLEVDSQRLSSEQSSILHKFKPEDGSENETSRVLQKSFFAYRSSKQNPEKLEYQIKLLLDKRSQLNSESKEAIWEKEIGFKTGLEPSVISELSGAIDKEGLDVMSSMSVLELIDWFVSWLQSEYTLLEKVFTKSNTIDQIKRAVGLKYSESYPMQEIVRRLDILRISLKLYVQGVPLIELDKSIPSATNARGGEYLTKARNFVLRLIPDLSFGFGLLSLVICEKAKEAGIKKEELSWNIRILASCIREGLDTSDKVFFKKNNSLTMRVETHLKFIENQA